MIDGIDHVAIVVKNLQASLEAFSALGLQTGPVGRYDEVGMNIAFVGDGPSRMELLEAFAPDSPVADHPGGLHHVAMNSEDIEAAFKNMNDSPRFLIEGDIRNGAHSRIFFFRIAGEEETLYECVEMKPERTV